LLFGTINQARILPENGKGNEMLIETIEFEIHNFELHTDESYLVENTETNYALIAGHKSTRNIHFTKTFHFQFAKETRTPAFIIEALEIAVEDYLSEYEREFELDEVDEMVGAF
jgi:hypothetical protein